MVRLAVTGPHVPGGQSSGAPTHTPLLLCAGFAPRLLVDTDFPRCSRECCSLIVPFDSFTGKLRGLYDSYFTTDGKLSLRPFDQDFWKNEDWCCCECYFDPFHITTWGGGQHFRQNTGVEISILNVILHGDLAPVDLRSHLARSYWSHISKKVRVPTRRLVSYAELGRDSSSQPRTSFLLWWVPSPVFRDH